ncbi:expressed unknown protein [Seminavis robusta]|uniref:Uncharacterized protein n=1 Tax=Seminavis robusta TaxID=568900 RepID=A0A9N8H233_9STRA|nr:expressed unknown protein [Seminavis robusta]|eukprot:Sro3_g002450.1 n/a (194) ;mRNA; r:162596-163177
MTYSTITTSSKVSPNGVTPTSPLKSLTKQPRRASLTSKFPRSSSLFSEQWKLSASEEVRKAQDQILSYRALRRVSVGGTPEQRAMRCKSLVSAALDTLSQDVTEGSDMSMSSSAPEQRVPVPVTEVPSKESLYGYEEHTPAPTCAAAAAAAPTVRKANSSRRRYQRRCSVTEFSLKAAVLAKVQLARESRLQL